MSGVPHHATKQLSVNFDMPNFQDATPAMRENYARNAPYAKSGAYNTRLSDEEENRFRDWIKSQNVPFNPDARANDYDMRGYWRALQAGSSDAHSAVNPTDGRLHYTDRFKTPYHRSFSNESQWATPDAPRWHEDKLIDKRGAVVFDGTKR